ncbi:(E)-4-hydroxy-3-methylbut-2-enyl-diphosphate synthase (flavodoxin) [Brevinematales bacterium NS]|nr:flavodoxin-dependent (E)-4-hydroxy-3-methylbut-2-enyl-diphosphate synthase [Brevinematales bacterium]QJR22801.1 (E)-4-hydroxy-3-methylbut-2-enyl-diphosphate synthase (flavodoxin) [Brevinematales bacterium NS]
MITRRKTRKIYVGPVAVGGDAPISIQSMTSVPTVDVKAVLNQLHRLEEVGCDIVRLGIPDEASAYAVGEIKKHTSLPLVADIHFDYRLALICIQQGIDGLRLNPGNIRQREHVETVVKACKERRIPIRIGVNSGSIDRSRYPHPTAEALVDSALRHIQILEELDFFDIKVSLKSSDVPTMVEAYRLFATQRDYPLHLGVTEAGPLSQALIKSGIGIGSLLLDGIGDTLRVSITGDNLEDEIEAARIILRSLGLRKEGIEIISCPTCARKEFDVARTVELFQQKTRHIREYLRVAIMGCVVNGPGEALESDIGIAIGKSSAIVIENGQKTSLKIPNPTPEAIATVLVKEIEKRLHH